MQQDQNIATVTVSNNGISLIQFTKTAWEKRKAIIKITILFSFVGLLVALLSPVQYAASTIIAPSGGGTRLSSSSLLRAMTGGVLQIPQSADEPGQSISLSLYTEIVSSIPFQKELMHTTKLNFSNKEHPVSPFEYYTQKKPLLKYLSYLFRPDTIESKKQIKNMPSDSTLFLPFSVREDSVRKLLDKRISININEKENYITVSSRLPEALPAAQLTRKVAEVLQCYITDIKLEKVNSDLEFVKNCYEEIKVKFYSIQEKRARFRDQNKHVATAIAKAEEDKLNSEYTLTYEIYSELARQLEELKIEVKKNTPIFSVIEPVSMPLRKSKPKRILILTLWIFLGGVTGVLYVTGKKYLIPKLKEQWKATD